jgi:hypothetical protein
MRTMETRDKQTTSAAAAKLASRTPDGEAEQTRPCPAPGDEESRVLEFDFGGNFQGPILHCHCRSPDCDHEVKVKVSMQFNQWLTKVEIEGFHVFHFQPDEPWPMALSGNLFHVDVTFFNATTGAFRTHTLTSKDGPSDTSKWLVYELQSPSLPHTGDEQPYSLRLYGDIDGRFAAARVHTKTYLIDTTVNYTTHQDISPEEREALAARVERGVIESVDHPDGRVVKRLDRGTTPVVKVRIPFQLRLCSCWLVCFDNQTLPVCKHCSYKSTHTLAASCTRMRGWVNQKRVAPFWMKPS